MPKVVNVYLRHSVLGSAKREITAEVANHIDGFLYVIPADSGQPDYAFNMDHVIYWTSKEIL